MLVEEGTVVPCSSRPLGLPTDLVNEGVGGGHTHTDELKCALQFSFGFLWRFPRPGF